MFIVTMFIIDKKNWKEHKCASADECITNCVISIMEYCSAIKKKKKKKRWTADTYNTMDKSQKHCARWKNPDM